MTGTDALDGATTGPLSWDDVCERFHDIRVRAHAHALQDDWRALVTERFTPSAALLSRWQRLADEIERLDAGRDDSTVRYGDDVDEEPDEAEDSDGAWLDEWESASGRFGCPGDLCRRVRTADLLPPTCWLQNREMQSIPSVAQAPPDGAS
ncbi:hypothetical protein [Streptomyces sp. NPDC048277]|uniref:hypothetical protein n=1 Tax=Streptomyces sp. NPDC048277 TaxID=3155027 RepID=UPI0033E01CFB